MDKEVSTMMHMGVALIALSLVMYVVIVTVHIGNGLKADMVNNAVNTHHQVETSYLRSLEGQDNVVMPKAAIYTIVGKERSGITKIIVDGDIYNVQQNGMWELGEGLDWASGIEGADLGSYVYPEDILMGRKHTLQGKAEMFIENNGKEYEVEISTIRD